MIRLKNIISLLPAKLVVIDLEKHFLKAIVAKRKGDRLVITSCAEIERSDDDFSHDLGKLLQRKEHYSGYATILVTDQVHFLASELSMPPGKKLPQDKLLAAASWEMEPYLDFSPSEGLFCYQLQEYKAKGDTTPVLISAIDRKTYSGFSEILKNYRLTLQRVYSPEGALSYASYLPAEGKNKIVIDCRQDSAKGIFLLPTGPFMFQTLPLDVKGLQESVKDVIQDLSASADTVDEIVISGDGDLENLIRELKPEFEKIRIWKPEADAPVKIEFGPDLREFGPQYAAVLGAVLQEFKVTGKTPFGITDRVFFAASIAKKLKEDRRLLPAFILVLFFLSLAGHYVNMKVSIDKYQTDNKALENERKRLLAPIEKKRQITEKINNLRGKKEYLEKTIPAAQKNLLAVLCGLSYLRPNDMVLTRFYQEEDTRLFAIEGNAYRGDSVARFNRELSKLALCEEVKIKSLQNHQDGKKGIFPYHFVINLKFKQE